VVARVASLGALALALVLVVVILFGGGDSYSVRAYFQDAGGLVSGDQVIIGPATIGSITDVSLSDNGQAQISIKLDPSAAPLRQGTTAHVYENSLSGVANHYVALVPGPKSAAPIPSGGAISSDHTTSFVGLDQVFDAFDPLTRLGLRGLIRGEAASIKGRALPANRTLLYLAPGLSSTSDVTRQLALNEPAFDGLLVQGAQALQALASRSRQLTELVANTNATTAAIAGQSQALQRALALLPGALTHTTSTFAGLRSTLDALDPVVAASKPASRQLAQFSAALRVFTDASIPTLGHLSVLISNPSGSGDLTSLFSEAPALARAGKAAFPRLIQAMNNSQKQVDYLRYYTPDVVASLANLGQAGAYYDANGHYTRTQPYFNAFALGGSNVLSSKPAFARYQGLQTVHGRCPGGAVQPAPDGSAPWAVPGCSPSTTPPGP
jgi:phospholipid/cholesterol/gamma-HCH transport system substrate-binding protein